MRSAQQPFVQPHHSIVDLQAALDRWKRPAFKSVEQLAHDECVEDITAYLPTEVFVPINQSFVLLEGLMRDGKTSFDFLLVNISVMNQST